MAAILTVKDIRETIHNLESRAWDESDEAARIAANNIFHEILEDMLGPDDFKNAFVHLEYVDPDNIAKEHYRGLLDHVYPKLFAPRLSLYHSVLTGHTDTLLRLWEAVQELLRWLGTLSNMHVCGSKPISWPEFRRNLRAGIPEDVEIKLEEWEKPVRIQGIGDSIVIGPKTGKWFSVGLQIGSKTNRATDLEACLDHLLLSHTSNPDSKTKNATITSVFFTPDLRKHPFDRRSLKNVHPELMSIIGRTAGVMGQSG